MNLTDNKPITAIPVAASSSTAEPIETAQAPTEYSDWDANLERRIAERAYELYEQRGGRDGDAYTDWLQAEREIRGKAPVIEDQDNPTRPIGEQTDAVRTGVPANVTAAGGNS